MKLQLLMLFGISMFALNLNAQQKVKDGSVTGGNLINKDALLELESNNKGLLHARIALIETINPSPLIAHVAGMMVYNIATSKDVVPGIYYNDGTRWVKSSKGDTGAPGPQGPVGLKGAEGPQGLAGPKGDIGLPGPIGLTGATGPQGTAGVNGINGVDGAKGDKGDIGLPGPIGLTGATGPQGTAGVNGINGVDGAKGDKGDIGLPGPIGLTGATGPQGTAGVNGINGVDGAKGDKGDIGLPGPIGLTGATGPQGTAGVNGINGVDGAKGDKGDIGLPGPIGLTGATGPQGTAGVNGINGVDGVKGDKGDIGLPGPIGLTGATGPQGTAGVNGINGVDGVKGDKGDIGLPGPIGLTGATGLQGTAGVNGINGVDGAKGDKGDPGLNGQGGVSQAGTGINITGTGTPEDPYIINNTVVDTDNQTITDFNLDNTTKILTLTLERGNTKTIDLTALINITADNGLTKSGINTQLGGTLIKPTTIVTDVANTLALAGLQTGSATDNLIVADPTSGVLKSIPTANLTVEPWNVRATSNKSTLNSDNIYQQGNVAIGTQNGIGTFHVDAAKNNATTGTPTSTQVLDDIIVTPGGRIGFGYSPSDLVLSGNQFDDKVTFQANGDLDVNYSLATTSNAQAIVHRNIISSGTIGARTARPNGTSIAAFEGHTSTSSGTYGAGSLVTQQRAGVVLRTGKYTSNGGEIWLGTSGANYDGTPASGPGNAYRAIMDEKGNWSFGADPNGDVFYRNPSQRLDLILGGVRIGALGYGALAAWRTAEAAERPNYISTDPADRLVVADANGVLKTKQSSMLISTNNAITKNPTTSEIELGGALNRATTITTDASYTLALAGLQTGASTDNIVVADPTSGILKTIASSLLSSPEPLQIQGTTNKATANTDNVYQMGKVAVNKNITDYQLEVAGDFKTDYAASGGLHSGIITNLPGLGIPMNISYLANNADLFSATEASTTTLRPGIATLQSTNGNGGGNIAAFSNTTGGTVSFVANNAAGDVSSSIWGYSDGTLSNVFLSSNKQGGEHANITIEKLKGVSFDFNKADGTVEGTYTFPRNNGLPNQVLATNGSSPAQLMWTDASNISSEPWKVVGTGNPATTNTQNIYQMGNIGVQDNNPNSTLAVNGSVSNSIRVITANDQANNTDYTIVNRAPGAINLILPDPATCKGRMYYIINNGGASITTSRSFEVSTGQTQNSIPRSVSGVNSPNPNFGNKFLIQSDGTTWVLLQLG